MKKHVFLSMTLDDSGFHYAKFDDVVQGTIKTICIRATEDSAEGDLDAVYLIHNPDRHKPKASRPPDDLLSVLIEDVELNPSNNQASLRTEVDDEPSFSGGLGVVVDCTIAGEVTLSIVLGLDI